MNPAFVDQLGPYQELNFVIEWLVRGARRQCNTEATRAGAAVQARQCHPTQCKNKFNIEPYSVRRIRY